MWGLCVSSLFCYAVLCVFSSFVIIPVGKRWTFIVLCMLCGFYCYCSMPLHHGTVSGLQCVIVAIPGHTHLIGVVFVRRTHILFMFTFNFVVVFSMEILEM